MNFIETEIQLTHESVIITCGDEAGDDFCVGVYNFDGDLTFQTLADEMSAWAIANQIADGYDPEDGETK